MTSVSLTSAAVALGLFLATSMAEAALTTEKCLVAKRKAWITFRKCQGTEETKQLRGKPADLAKCTTKHQEALGKADVKAAKAAIACRYRDNGDRTVTDFDTGLMWEKKTNDGLECAFGSPLCVEYEFEWNDAMGQFISRLNGFAAGFSDVPIGFASHNDWRLPTFVELKTIIDLSQPMCGFGSTCIDAIFGPTKADYYWSSTTSDVNDSAAFVKDFGSLTVGTSDKADTNFVRAVRNAL